MKFKNLLLKKSKKSKESTEEKSREVQKKPVRLGWVAKSFYILAAVSLFIYIAAIIFPSFADFFNRYPAAAVRTILAYATYILPFSLAELILILLVPAAVFVIIYAYRRYCDSWHDVLIFGGKALCIVSLIFSMFVWTLGTGYRTTPLEEKLGLPDQKITAEALWETSEIMIENINDLVSKTKFGEDGFSVMPYSRNEMNKKLMDAYAKLCEKYSFIPRLYSRTKPVMLSELMSYTHITGIYTFFTGEANININFPNFTIPFTAAHELAHQRGFAREDEANFIAFLVCIESDDPYLRYSGYTNMLSYLLDAFYAADKSPNHADYKELYAKVDSAVRAEDRAYYEFFQKYADNIVADVSGAVNDTFLQIQGTEGTVSYGLVVELAVKYYSEG